ncbi:MAG: hypothetical protein ABL916_17555 [Burkholderiaceae bacterium]
MLDYTLFQYRRYLELSYRRERRERRERFVDLATALQGGDAVTAHLKKLKD